MYDRAPLVAVAHRRLRFGKTALLVSGHPSSRRDRRPPSPARARPRRGVRARSVCVHGGPRICLEAPLDWPRSRRPGVRGRPARSFPPVQCKRSPPGLHGDDLLIVPVVGVGPLRTEARNGTIDDIGPQGADAGVVHPHLLSGILRQRHHHYVGAKAELSHPLPICLHRRVRDDAALPAARHDEASGPPPGVATRRLHLDHLGTKVGEDHPSQGDGQPGADLKYVEPRQRRG